jgi:hypothetical protein
VRKQVSEADGSEEFGSAQRGRRGVGREREVGDGKGRVQRTAQRKRWWVGWHIRNPLPCVGLGPAGGSDSGGTAWVDRGDFAVGVSSVS